MYTCIVCSHPFSIVLTLIKQKVTYFAIYRMDVFNYTISLPSARPIVPIAMTAGCIHYVCFHSFDIVIWWGIIEQKLTYCTFLQNAFVCIYPFGSVIKEILQIVLLYLCVFIYLVVFSHKGSVEQIVTYFAF